MQEKPFAFEVTHNKTRYIKSTLTCLLKTLKDNNYNVENVEVFALYNSDNSLKFVSPAFYINSLAKYASAQEAKVTIDLVEEVTRAIGKASEGSDVFESECFQDVAEMIRNHRISVNNCFRSAVKESLLSDEEIQRNVNLYL